MIRYAINKKFYFFCQEAYKMSLNKLHISQILLIYKMFYDTYKLLEKTDITRGVIQELLTRQIPLKTFVDRIPFIRSTVAIKQNQEIFQSIEMFIKPGECWNITKSILLRIEPYKYIIEQVLHDCIRTKKLSVAQDINNILISKLNPAELSVLNEHLMTQFKSLLPEKVITDTDTTKSIQNFGEDYLEMSTIASPDPERSPCQMASPKRNNVIVTNRSDIHQKGATIDGKPYILHPIGNYFILL